MAKILFTWELGAGVGHIAPYVRLAQHLVANGHEVCFALKELSQAYTLLHDEGISYVQAPINPRGIKDRIESTFTYPYILHNIGFSDVPCLTGLLQAWRCLFRLYEPDVVIFDHSPTALFAARDSSFGKICMGSGFVTPPAVYPMPIMTVNSEEQPDMEKIVAHEISMVASANRAARNIGLPSLQGIGDLFDVDVCVFRTFKELDHYPERTGATYWGAIPSEPGELPQWPKGEGKKIFAYLKPFDALPVLLQKLNDLSLPCIIYGDGLSPQLMQEYASDTLKFVSKPQDMKTIGDQCDLAIVNANHGSVASLLLSGTPMLLLPLHLEQMLVARNVVKLGAGLTAPKLRAEGILFQLNELLSSDTYRIAAQRFADQYAYFDAQAQMRGIVDMVEKVALRNSGGETNA